MTQTKQLNEILDIAKGKKVNVLNHKTKDSVPYLLIDTLRGKEPEFFTEDKKYTAANEQDILMVFDGANSGLVGSGLNGAVGSTIGRLRPKKDIYSKYITYFLSYNFSSLNQDVKGSAIPHVKPKKLLDLKIRYPSKEEQQLIVSEIEKQFSRLDESVKVLKSVKDKLQVYRKAVLKEAFEKINGRVSLYTIARIIDIDHKMPNKVENGIPFISPKDFFEPNGIDFDNAKNISNEDFLRLSKKCNPEEGDIIYSRIGTIGKVRLAPNKVFQISYSLCLIKLNEKKDRDYIFWVLQSPEIFSYAHKSKKSIGVPDLGLTEIRNFQIPYTNNLKLQQEIVQEIESKFSVIDKVEEVVNQSLIKSEKLRKSILKSAFEGKLVKFEEMK